MSDDPWEIFSRLPRQKFYILLDADHDHRPVEVDMMTWGRWFNDTEQRIVGRTGNDDFYVSTVFLGIDHRFWGKGPPILFETMVFRNGSSDEQERYSSWDDAEAGHKAMCRKVFGKLEVEDAHSRR